MTFILTVLLLAADFYYAKNIAGRRLVGLRWWNEVDTAPSAAGDSRWVFESADPETRTINATDKRFFWLAMYAQPALWIGMAVVAIFKMEFVSLILVGTWHQPSSWFSGLNNNVCEQLLPLSSPLRIPWLSRDATSLAKRLVLQAVRSVLVAWHKQLRAIFSAECSEVKQVYRSWIQGLKIARPSLLSGTANALALLIHCCTRRGRVSYTHTLASYEGTR